MHQEDAALSLELYRKAVNPARFEILRSAGGPLAFTSARGTWLEDPQGQRFLDMVAGYGAATLGHRHPEVVAALQSAISSGPPFNYPSSVPARAGELAGKLCDLAGRNLRKVYFGNSGAEGIEGALKFAMARTGRGKFLSFSEAFHGLTLGALSLIGAGHLKSPFSSLGVGAERVEFGDLDRLEHCLKGVPVAGVVVELVQGMGGARSWQREKLSELSALCRLHGAVLIIDEVLTGVGRTGKWFAFQHAGEDFAPDIVVASKGLTGGMIPMCAVLMTDEVYNAVFSGPGRAGIHASTFEGNLLAMAAGLTVIRVIEENDLLTRVSSLGDIFKQRLTAMQESGAGITDVRGSGLLLGLRVADGLFKDETLWGAAGCRQHLLKRNVITSLAAQSPRYINLTPAFTLTDADMELFFTRLEESLLEGRRGEGQDQAIDRAVSGANSEAADNEQHG
jgi:acetylornithine/succinyldiaminopimelate/putrescine aminotransferase